MATRKSGGAATPTTTVAGQGGAAIPTNLPNISVSAAGDIEMHTIGDWEIDQFVASSRGKLADVMFLFWGAVLGSGATTSTYIYDYFTKPNSPLPVSAFIQALIFAGALALAIAFTILNWKKTTKAEGLASTIRARPKVTYARKN